MFYIVTDLKKQLLKTEFQLLTKTKTMEFGFAAQLPPNPKFQPQKEKASAP